MWESRHFSDVRLSPRRCLYTPLADRPTPRCKKPSIPLSPYLQVSVTVRRMASPVQLQIIWLLLVVSFMVTTTLSIQNYGGKNVASSWISKVVYPRRGSLVLRDSNLFGRYFCLAFILPGPPQNSAQLVRSPFLSASLYFQLIPCKYKLCHSM